MFNKYLPSIINAVLFQITWFACVIGSSYNLLWPGVLSCVLLAAYQLVPKRRHPSDLKLVFFAIILGGIIDTLWLQMGFISFNNQWPVNNVSPVWMITLWVAFALTINHSLSWLKQHPLLPALMGLIGGPLSYLAGEKLGALNYHSDTLLVCSSIGIVWSLALTLFYSLSFKSDNQTHLVE